jgi:hypothetical protein
VQKKPDYCKQKLYPDLYRPISSSNLVCTLPPSCNYRPIHFRTIKEYESHYNSLHVNVCLVCKKVFPSQRLLELHLTEFHDPLSAARRDRGEKILACYVEGCPLKFRSPKNRRAHLQAKHSYPPNYYFGVVASGIDRYHNSLLLPERPKKKDTVEAKDEQVSMDTA